MKNIITITYGDKEYKLKFYGSKIPDRVWNRYCKWLKKQKRKEVKEHETV